MLKIVYLDQNKWIEFARTANDPTADEQRRAFVAQVFEQVKDGKLRLPLTQTNIYETMKINDQRRRLDLASLQARLSSGLVVRGRKSRLAVEIGTVLAEHIDTNEAILKPDWFLSELFFEAVIDADDENFTPHISTKLVEFIRKHPSECMFSYLSTTPEEVRRTAVINFSNGSDHLRSTIENRRKKHANETLAMRRRIYSALLLLNDLEFIISVARKIGLLWTSVSDIGDKLARHIITKTPTYYIERELALRLEAENRAIEENDFRDMQSFCAVIPYCDLVIGEKLFINLARQAGLGTKFDTQLSTDLNTLEQQIR